MVLDQLLVFLRVILSNIKEVFYFFFLVFTFLFLVIKCFLGDEFMPSYISHSIMSEALYNGLDNKDNINVSDL